MQRIEDLIEECGNAKKMDLNKRATIVLQMIEHTITYPPLERITKDDLAEIDKCVKDLVKDLRKNKQYLFSVRISKIWGKREHLCELAKLWHQLKHDYMDNIEYHEEIKWLRNERKKLERV
ncbi:MAG: hypothetical protein ACFFFK_02605 [Candidatus Thorarchaeota archaeon]